MAYINMDICLVLHSIELAVFMKHFTFLNANVITYAEMHKQTDTHRAWQASPAQLQLQVKQSRLSDPPTPHGQH